MRQLGWIPVLAIIVAVSLTALGLLLVGIYVVEVAPLDRADRSMPLWMLPLPMFGTLIVSFDLLLAWAAVCAQRRFDGVPAIQRRAEAHRDRRWNPDRRSAGADAGALDRCSGFMRGLGLGPGAERSPTRRLR